MSEETQWPTRAAKAAAKRAAREAAREAARALREEVRRAVPEPPWWSAPRRGGRRAPLTRDAIVDAAVRLLDRGEGLDSLSMRRLGEELGTGPGSLYWHVRNKEELLDLVFDRLIGEQLPLPAPKPARWQQQVKDIARRALDVLFERPYIAEISIGRFPVGPNALEWTEGVLAILRAGGVPDREAAWGVHLLTTYFTAFAFETQTGLKTPEGEARPEEILERIHAHFHALPRERFPNIADLADELTRGDMDERFEFGLDAILAGLAAAASAARAPRKRPRRG